MSAWEWSVEVKEAMLDANVSGEVMLDVTLCCGGVAVPLEEVYAWDVTPLRSADAMLLIRGFPASADAREAVVCGLTGGGGAVATGGAAGVPRPNIWSICGRRD